MSSARPLITLAHGMTILWTLSVGIGRGQPAEQRSGRYGVTLRLPAEGLYAAEETQIEFRVVDHSAIDPVQGPTPVIRAQAVAMISMPSMPGMPQFEQRAHPEPLPGEYGVHPLFAHGGEYLLRIQITPPENPAFALEFPLKVLDASAAKGRKRPPPPFEVEVRAHPKRPKAGELTELEIVVRARENRKTPHDDFEVMHEKLMHLIVVSSDLATFAHEHPVLEAGGVFRIRRTFPSGGTYHLFADVAPRGAGSQVLLAKIAVQGKATARVSVDRAPLSLVSRQGTVEMKVVAASSLPVKRTIGLPITLRDVRTAAGVTNIERYLGALGHLILIHHDGTTYVHAHADESLPADKGEISFLVRFPKPGVYRAWAQFQRSGEILTGSFVLHASDESSGVAP